MTISRLNKARTISRMMHTYLHPRSACNSIMPASSLASPFSSAAAPTSSIPTTLWRRHGYHLHKQRCLHTSCSALQQNDIPTFTSATTATASVSPLLPSPGHIELVIGPMFAGKSSELLRRVAYYESHGLTVAIVKSNKDDRYSTTHVVTHDGDKKECHAVPSLAAFRETLTTFYTNADVIAIDEAQFFPDLKEFCTFAADHDDKRLVLAGLDGDFLRRKFGQVLDLVPLADKVTKLTATCRFCQEEQQENHNTDKNNRSSSSNGKNNGASSSNETDYPAVVSLRISAESGSEQEVVGGADTYAPVCRKHYVQFSDHLKKS